MVAASNKLDYVITTNAGAIPYIAFPNSKQFLKVRKVYLDDFLYKDSFYEKGNSMPLRTFIASPEQVCLGFRGDPKILKSKRGNYKLTPGAYEEVIKTMDIALYASYEGNKIYIDEKEVLEADDIPDFMNLLEKGHRLFGTQFINNLIEKRRLLCLSEGVLLEKDVEECGDDYLKHLVQINEINGMTTISENNYLVFYNFVEEFNKRNL